MAYEALPACEPGLGTEIAGQKRCDGSFRFCGSFGELFGRNDFFGFSRIFDVVLCTFFKKLISGYHIPVDVDGKLNLWQFIDQIVFESLRVLRRPELVN